MKPRWKSSFNYAVKVAISHALYYTGLLQLWQTIVMRQKAVVLMYHRVLTPEERRHTGTHPALIVDTETFAKHMALLRRRFTVLSLEEFASRMERRIPFPSSSCLITFDDGWRDNYTNALPILAEHGFPSLVFLPANYIGRRRLFWPEALTHLLVIAVGEVRKQPSRRAKLEALLAPAGLVHVLDLRDDDPRQAIINAVRTDKRLPRAEMEALLVALAQELGVKLEDLVSTDGFVSWAEVEAMGKRRVAFGGHGAEHLLLTQASCADVDNEIRVSKELLDGRLEEPVPTFSYPNGYFTPDIASKVKDSGYRLAFITRRGFVSAEDDRFTVKRLNVHEGVTGSMPMFLARVVGLL